MPLERRDVEAALEKKGFVLGDGGDHKFFAYHTKEGEKTSVWTKTSHGTKYKTLGDNLVSAMAKQCELTSPEFKKFVECTLSQDDFEELLIQRERITIKKS